MARLPRFILPGQPQHIIQRGNNRQVIFRADDDYLFYLEKLHAAAVKHQCDIHAYVLMTNHVHLLVTPHSKDSIGKMIQMLGRYYVQYFNYRYKRTGTLWEGRYKATLIDTDSYLFTCMQYIELNPVRAKMVEQALDYPWTSYHYNAMGQADKLVTTCREYKHLAKTKAGQQLAYRQLFQATLPDKTLQTIREATNKAWVLGRDTFKKRIQKKIPRQVETQGRGGDRKSARYRKSGSLTP